VRIRGLSAYRPLWDLQKDLWRARLEGELDDTLLLLEHEPVVTLGKSADPRHLVTPKAVLERSGVDVVLVDRGGDVTYHGPGQLTGYLIADLKDLALDLHRFVRGLEEVMILALAAYGIRAGRIPGLTGVWVGREKIGAIGVHMSRWVSTHGFAFNVNTTLDAYTHIVPCGIRDLGVTSMAAILGTACDLEEAAVRLADAAGRVFLRRVAYRTVRDAGGVAAGRGTDRPALGRRD
jgi:lipoate-protein ligase B